MTVIFELIGLVFSIIVAPLAWLGGKHAEADAHAAAEEYRDYR